MDLVGVFTLILSYCLVFDDYVVGRISDKRKCADAECSVPISHATTLLSYYADDSRLLSFSRNVKAEIYSKEAGDNPTFWEAKGDSSNKCMSDHYHGSLKEFLELCQSVIKGKRGYVPKDFMREDKVLVNKEKVTFIVPTGRADESKSNKTEETHKKQIPTPNPYETPKLPVANSKGLFTMMGGVSADSVPMSSPDINPQSARKYQVIEGTTIAEYDDPINDEPDSPKIPSEVKETHADSKVSLVNEQQLVEENVGKTFQASDRAEQNKINEDNNHQTSETKKEVVNYKGEGDQLLNNAAESIGPGSKSGVFGNLINTVTHLISSGNDETDKAEDLEEEGDDDDDDVEEDENDNNESLSNEEKSVDTSAESYNNNIFPSEDIVKETSDSTPVSTSNEKVTMQSDKNSISNQNSTNDISTSPSSLNISDERDSSGKNVNDSSKSNESNLIYNDIINHLPVDDKNLSKEQILTKDTSETELETDDKGEKLLNDSSPASDYLLENLGVPEKLGVSTKNIDTNNMHELGPAAGNVEEKPMPVEHHQSKDIFFNELLSSQTKPSTNTHSEVDTDEIVNTGPKEDSDIEISTVDKDLGHIEDLKEVPLDLSNSQEEEKKIEKSVQIYSGNSDSDKIEQQHFTEESKKKDNSSEQSKATILEPPKGTQPPAQHIMIEAGDVIKEKYIDSDNESVSGDLKSKNDIMQKNSAELLETSQTQKPIISSDTLATVNESEKLSPDIKLETDKALASDTYRDSNERDLAEKSGNEILEKSDEIELNESIKTPFVSEMSEEHLKTKEDEVNLVIPVQEKDTYQEAEASSQELKIVNQEPEYVSEETATFVQETGTISEESKVSLEKSETLKLSKDSVQEVIIPEMLELPREELEVESFHEDVTDNASVVGEDLGMFSWLDSVFDLFKSLYQNTDESDKTYPLPESMDSSLTGNVEDQSCRADNMGEESCHVIKHVTWQESVYSSNLSSPWDLLEKVPVETTVWLIITALVVLIFSLGHYYIEAHRRDGPLVALINKLEREVLILKKESCILEDRLAISQHQVEAWNTSSSENDALIVELQQELEENKTARLELEEQVATLKEELESVTESGLEMHRLLEESLSSQDGSQVLLSTVESLREKLQHQEEEIAGLSQSLTSKNIEVEELQAQLAQSAEVLRSLEDKVIAVTREKEEEALQLKDQHRQIIAQLEEVMETKALDETRVSTEMSKLRLFIEELQKTLAEKDSEMDVLKDVVKQLRSTDSNDKLDALFNVVAISGKLKTVTAERDELREKFLEEEGARKLLEGHMKKITQEVADLKNSFETAEKEKIEALNKLQVLSNYFKEKESQLQKELGLQESMWLQKQSDDHTIYEQMRSLREENQKYKLQNESLKKEIVEQEASFKIQLANVEQKAHENWVTSRQAERRLKEVQQEAAQLRNRLTMEKNTNYSLDEKQNISESNGDPSSPPPSLMFPPTTSPPFMMYPPMPPPGDFVPPPPLMGSPYPSDSRPPPLGRISSPPLDHRFSPPPPLPYPPYDYPPYGHHSPSPPPPLPSHHRTVHKPQPREMSREQKDHVPNYTPDGDKSTRRNKR